MAMPTDTSRYRPPRLLSLLVLILAFLAVLAPLSAAQDDVGDDVGDPNAGDGDTGDGSGEWDGTGSDDTGSDDPPEENTDDGTNQDAPAEEPTPEASPEDPSSAPISSTTPPATSTTSSASSSASASASASATHSAWAVAQTITVPSASIGADNAVIPLPALNRTHPAVLVVLPSFSAVKLVLNVARKDSVGTADDGGKLRTFVTTAGGDAYFDFSSAQHVDSASGGTGYLGWWNVRSGNGGEGHTWDLSWDRGFANWTHGVELRNTPQGRQWNFTGSADVTPHVLIARGLQDDMSLTNFSSPGNVFVNIIATSIDQATSVVTTPGISKSPLLGDTTATSALIFSPLLYSAPLAQPKYPNYTLPGAELDPVAWADVGLGSNTTDVHNFYYNLSLAVVPTGSFDVGLVNSVYAIASAWDAVRATETNPDGIALGTNVTQWTSVGGREGYRQLWVVDGLKAGTNYTAWWFNLDQGMMTTPVWLDTKEDGFPCPLVLPTDLCPGVAYASPVSADGGTVSSIPDEFASVLTTNLQAFQTSLLSTACGRDRYSYAVTCLDCYMAYRDWLCRIVLPQCSSTTSFSDVSAHGPQSPITRSRSADSPRNANLPSYPYDYTELMPCLATCSNVDRKCPASLGFICPHRSFNANESYAYVGNDDKQGDGAPENDWPALDVWGNRWCNA